MMPTQSVYINLIAEDRAAIPYRPTIARMLGSVLATIFLQQVIHWWKAQNCQPFYKFIAPCSHQLYRIGDSWREELAFSRSEMDAVLAKVATKITKGVSKSEALSLAEPQFDEHGKMKNASSLLIYWTDSNRVTWFQVNEQLLGNALEQLYLGNAGIPHYLERQESNITFHTQTTSETNTKNLHASPLGDAYTFASHEEEATKVHSPSTRRERKTKRFESVSRRAQSCRDTAAESKPYHAMMQAYEHAYQFRYGDNTRLAEDGGRAGKQINRLLNEFNATSEELFKCYVYYASDLFFDDQAPPLELIVRNFDAWRMNGRKLINPKAGDTMQKKCRAYEKQQKQRAEQQQLEATARQAGLSVEAYCTQIEAERQQQKAKQEAEERARWSPLLGDEVEAPNTVGVAA